MANRYWVGGAGNWGDTAHWSGTSGGSGGSSVPSSSDDVFFDFSSGSPLGFVVAMNVAANCRDLNISSRVTIGASPPTANLFSIYGSLTNTGGDQVSFDIDIAFKATSTGKTITMDGAVIINATSAGTTFDGIGGGWTLQDDLSVYPCLAPGSGINLKNGSLNTNGKTVQCAQFNSNYSSVRALTLGNSTIELFDINNGGAATVFWDISTATGLTFDPGTSTIQFQSQFTDSAQSFRGGGLTYFNFLAATMASGGSVTIYGNNSFNDLTLIPNSLLYLEAGMTQTCTSLGLFGSAGNLVTIRSTSFGSTTYLSCSNVPNITYVDVKDNTALGPQIPFFDDPGGVDSGHNVNWIFGPHGLWSYDDHKELFSGVAGSSILEQNIGVKAGHTYRVAIDFESGTQSVTVGLGANDNAYTFTGPGIVSHDMPATGDDGTIYIVGTAPDSNGSILSLSVRETN
jgi:hypothetical protein